MPWSDWQVYGPKTFDVSESGRRGVSLNASTPEIAADADAAAMLEETRQVFVDYPASTIDSSSTDNSNVGVRYSALMLKKNDPVTGLSTFASGIYTQVIVSFRGSDQATSLDFFPPLLDTLVYGVDYAENPDTGNFVEYESDTSTFSGWLDHDCAIELSNVIAQEEDGGVDTSISLDPVDVRVFAVNPINLSDTWHSYAPGPLIDTVTVSPVDGVEGSGTRQAITLATSGITDEDITLVFQTDHLDTLPFYVGDISMPATVSVNPHRIDITVNARFFATMFASTPHVGTMQIVYDLPRFRYWVPGVNWHTVGGHWGDLGSVPLKILTALPDGNTWVDVVDGPA